MSSAVSIRPVALANIEAAVALLRAQLQEHDIESNEDSLRAIVQAVVTEPRHGFLRVAEQDGRLAGIAYVAAHLSAEHGGIAGWLEELYVIPELRGLGIGSALLREIIGRAQQLAWRALELEVVAGHERTVPLYVRHGFHHLSRARYTRVIAPAGPRETHG